MEQPDSRLVRRMMEDDSQAFDQLAKEFYPKILRMAYLISGSYADSQDIVQETFVICWTNRKKLKEPEHFSKWLYKILSREAWRFCRKRGREQPAKEVFGTWEPEGASALEDALARSRNETLYAAVKALPVKQRTAVVLYYFNQMSTREIAEVTGCLEGTVKSRLHTARNNLKAALTEAQALEGR